MVTLNQSTFPLSSDHVLLLRASVVIIAGSDGHGAFRTAIMIPTTAGAIGVDVCPREFFRRWSWATYPSNSFLLSRNLLFCRTRYQQLDLFSPWACYSVKFSNFERCLGRFIIRVNYKTWRYLGNTYLLLTRHVIVLKVSSQHSASNKSPLASKAVHYRKYLTTLAHIDSICAV